MSEHTKEPWKTRKGFDDETVEIYAPNPKIKKPFKPAELATVVADDKQGKANARRIVACVNACAGIDTESLESTKTGELCELVTWKIRKVEKQRDDLLAALEPFAKAYEPEAKRIKKYGATEEIQGFLDRNEITPVMKMGDFRKAFEAIASVKDHFEQHLVMVKGGAA